MIIVSACLLGIDCRYDGTNAKNEAVMEYLVGKSFIPVCPEQLGGLCTPRDPVEIEGYKVLSEEGEDVTPNFHKGAEEVLKISKLAGAQVAILKDGSPSCGSERIYDGTFTGKKIPGKGIAAKTLESHGIAVFNENNFKSIDEK